MASTWFVSKLFREDTCDFRGITQDDKGNFYCTSSVNNSVYKFDIKTRTAKALFENGGEFVRTIVFHNGVLYISSISIILCYSVQTGTLSILAGKESCGHKDGSFEDAEFNYIGGIIVDLDGNLYCTEDDYIRFLDMSNRTVTTIAGSGEEFSRRDGPALEAGFSSPDGIVLKDGTFYIADNRNGCIRQLKDGVVSTIELSLSSDSDITCLFITNDDTLIIGDNRLTTYNIKEKRLRVHHVPGLPSCRNFYVDRSGTIYVAHQNTIYKVESTWKWIRYLWIGHLKEDASYCLLASIPKEMVKEIAILCG